MQAPGVSAQTDQGSSSAGKTIFRTSHTQPQKGPPNYEWASPEVQQKRSDHFTQSHPGIYRVLSATGF